MELDLEIIKWGAYILAGVLGWFVRVLWTAQEQMRKDFSELEKNLPIHYVRQDDFREVIKDMKEGFKEAIHPVLSKLDRITERIEEDRKEADSKFKRKDE